MRRVLGVTLAVVVGVIAQGLWAGAAHAATAIVTNAALRENDCNLNIRRYADNAPPPKPHDVRAHLVGGVPKSEVQAKAGLFEAHGLDPLALFVERDVRYFDFRSELTTRQAIAVSIGFAE